MDCPLEPTRAELVADLRARYQAEGLAGLAPVVDHILTHGRIHAIDWRSCDDCGADVDEEPQTNGLASGGARLQVPLCDPCRDVRQVAHNRLQAARERRRYAAR